MGLELELEDVQLSTGYEIMRKPRKVVFSLRRLGEKSELSSLERLSWRRRAVRGGEGAPIDRGGGEIEIAATFRFVFSRPVARACVTRISSFYHLASRLKFARLFHQCKPGMEQRWEMQRGKKIPNKREKKKKKKTGQEEKKENFAKKKTKKGEKKKEEKS